ncbi:MAG: GAF domain-containing protein [Candidatus Kapaibacterium sp.]
MGKQNLQIRNFITPGDILAVIVIVAGLVAALFFEEIAIRMIGVSISILGAVALFMLISQRLTDVVQSRYPKTGTPPPEFKVTTTTDSSAKRIQVEDFGQTFGGEDDFPIITSNISKQDSSSNEPVTTTQQGDLSYNDGFSGMRIVGKVKTGFKDSSHSSKVADNSRKNEFEENIDDSIKQHQATVDGKILQNESRIKSEDIKDEINEISKSHEEYNQQDFETSKSHNKAESDTTHSVHEHKDNVVKKATDIPLNVFMETDQLIGEEPRKEFEYFMTRILTIIRASTDTRTALFFLYNPNSDELIMESFVTSIPIALKTKLRLSLGNDIISRVASSGKPQVLSEINPAAEMDLIPYYNNSTSTGSLIAVPVYWGDGIVGVMAADSESKSAYDSSTVAFLGHFTKLIGALVKSYTQKYDLIQTSKTLEAINNFYKIATGSKTGSENISESIAESIKFIFHNAVIGLCGFDAQSDNWVIKSYKGSGSDISGTVIDIDNTLIGTCIYENKAVYLKDGESYDGLRVYHGESPHNGDFMAVPIRSNSQIYGAIFVESLSNESFTEFDIFILELLGQHSGNSIERLFLLESLNTSALLDSSTGMLNPSALYLRLQEEVERSKYFKTEMSLCFFKFDSYRSLDQNNYPNRFEYTSQIILERVKHHLKPFEIYGNVDESTFGIIFIGKEAAKSKITAEIIRNDVANTLIEHSGSSFSVTISMGLVSPGKDYDIDTLIRNTMIALNRASENGNQVQVLY